jgi:hypothetical protein
MLLKPSECQEIQSMRQRADEFLAFLRIDRETPARLDLRLVIDNYSIWRMVAASGLPCAFIYGSGKHQLRNSLLACT